ncbi:UNVERIFIED_CONTAM: hypothetical protein PYX00_002750 [Menopon gallinae]|uniref:Uncharacterized protein n=1 Tax=Menopon gallinae TaxID=328185 RepID=A0AAW2HYF2_9NEOP
MIVEFVCALVSATILAACWVPCCLVMCGCAKPQVSSKTIQIPFFYFSPEISKPFRQYFNKVASTEAPPPPPPPPIEIQEEPEMIAAQSNLEKAAQKLQRNRQLVAVQAMSQCLIRRC